MRCFNQRHILTTCNNFSSRNIFLKKTLWNRYKREYYLSRLAEIFPRWILPRRRARRPLSLTHAQPKRVPRPNALVCNFISRGRYLSLVSHYTQLFQRVIRKRSRKRRDVLLMSRVITSCLQLFKYLLRATNENISDFDWNDSRNAYLSIC